MVQFLLREEEGLNKKCNGPVSFKGGRGAKQKRHGPVSFKYLFRGERGLDNKNAMAQGGKGRGPVFSKGKGLD